MIHRVVIVTDTEYGSRTATACLQSCGTEVGERGRLSATDDECQVGHQRHHVTAFQLCRLTAPCQSDVHACLSQCTHTSNCRLLGVKSGFPYLLVPYGVRALGL